VTNANGGLIMTGIVTNSRTINNANVATYNGTGNNTLGGGTFNNLPTGTFTLEGNNDFVGGAFNNQGTFTKRAGGSGDGVTRFFAALNNSGKVDLQSGTLSVERDDTSTGDIDTQIGTTLQFVGDGVHVFNAGADVTARGLVIVTTSFNGSTAFGAANFFAGSTYTATGATQILSGSVRFFDITANMWTLDIIGGEQAGNGTVNVSGLTTWSGGTMKGASGGVTNCNGGLVMTGNLFLSGGRTLNNPATATYNGVANNIVDNNFQGNGGTFNNLATGTFLIDGNNDWRSGSSFNNQGTFIKRAGASGDGVTTFFSAFNNSGIVDLESGTLSCQAGIVGSGLYKQSAGSTNFSGGTLSGTNVNIDGGSLVGSGAIIGNVTNSGGQIRPGAGPGPSPGAFAITGNYSQGAAGTLNVEIAGPGVAQFDQLNVVGAVGVIGAGISGALNVSLIGGYVPSVGDTFTIISNDGTDPVVGTFTGLPDGATFIVGGALFRINYSGTGNDVVLTCVALANTAPSNVVLNVSNPIDENSTATVNGSFTDPDATDTHTLVIDWGPGEGSTTLNLPAGVLTFSASHQYLDDNPTGTASDVYPVTATVTEPAGGSAGGSTSVTVNNVAPAVTGLVVTPNPVAENDTMTLTGSFTDPGTQDTHSVVISWGPGEVTTTLNLAASVLTFAASHQYLDDNPGGTGADLYPIGVTVTDDDTGSGSGGTAVTVNNVAPTITSLSQSATEITEGGSVTIAGAFSDPGTQDGFTVTVSWGPGEGGDSINITAGAAKVFSFTHTYLDDNPTGTSADNYPITLTVTDDDTGSVTGIGNVTVDNAAPVVTIGNPAPGSVVTVGTPITFSAAFTDAGAADTHTAQWLFGLATSAGTVVESGGSGTVGDSYTFSVPGTYDVKLTVTDDDGGTTSDQILVTIVRRPTSTSLSSPSNPSVFGQSAIFTATAGDAAGGTTVRTGTVQFRVDGSDFGSPVPLVNGAASISIAGLAAGPHTIMAVYSGDDSFAGSTSDGFAQTINRASTAAAATVSAPTPLLRTDGLTISANISVVAPGSGTPAGTISFYDGPTFLGTVDVVSGTASLALGSTALTAGTHMVRAVYSGDGNFAGSDSMVAVTVFAPSAIQGLVYVDLDDNGQVDLGERAVAGVTVTLTGTDDLGHVVSRTVQTDSNGVYVFLSLRPSNAAGYTATETQPANLLDGRDSLGTVNGVLTGNAAVNDAFSAITLLQGGSLAENYNFGERPLTTGGVAAGQTATIGYWQNRNGQNLLRSLNGGPAATSLGHWLAVNFPNMYAALDGMTNADIAAYYKALFARTSQTAPGGPPKVDCQVMAAALAVYVTNQNLGGTTAAVYGFQVSATGLGTRTFNVGSNGAAFGVANNSVVSVMDLLLAMNARSRNGLLYDLNGDGRIDGSEAGYRTMANDVFTAINEAGDI
jgi:hypothetical protein